MNVPPRRPLKCVGNSNESRIRKKMDRKRIRSENKRRINVQQLRGIKNDLLNKKSFKKFDKNTIDDAIRKTQNAFASIKQKFNQPQNIEAELKAISYAFDTFYKSESYFMFIGEIGKHYLRFILNVHLSFKEFWKYTCVILERFSNCELLAKMLIQIFSEKFKNTIYLSAFMEILIRFTPSLDISTKILKVVINICKTNSTTMRYFCTNTIFLKWFDGIFVKIENRIASINKIEANIHRILVYMTVFLGFILQTPAPQNEMFVNKKFDQMFKVCLKNPLFDFCAVQSVLVVLLLRQPDFFIDKIDEYNVGNIVMRAVIGVPDNLSMNIDVYRVASIELVALMSQLNFKNRKEKFDALYNGGLNKWFYYLFSNKMIMNRGSLDSKSISISLSNFTIGDDSIAKTMFTTDSFGIKLFNLINNPTNPELVCEIMVFLLPSLLTFDSLNIVNMLKARNGVLLKNFYICLEECILNPLENYLVILKLCRFLDVVDRTVPDLRFFVDKKLCGLFGKLKITMGKKLNTFKHECLVKVERLKKSMDTENDMNAEYVLGQTYNETYNLINNRFAKLSGYIDKMGGNQNNNFQGNAFQNNVQGFQNNFQGFQNNGQGNGFQNNFQGNGFLDDGLDDLPMEDPPMNDPAMAQPPMDDQVMEDDEYMYL